MTSILEPFRFSFSAMASPCEILICGTQRELAEEAVHKAVAEVKRVESKYSRYLPSSVTSEINASAGSGASVRCDEETIWLLRFLDTLYHQSGGLFDATSGVLRRIWDFSKKEIPSDEKMETVLPLIGWSKVDLSNQSITLPRTGMEIDFGGIGKEYAADIAGQSLIKSGFANGYVNLGGDIRVLGPQPDGKAWAIGIQDPRERHKIIATIPVYSGGLATSGDYEKFFELDGSRYCHILNPMTGMPVKYWRSVSVLSNLAIVAGANSTIAMLKEAGGKDWLEQSGMAFLCIDGEGFCFNSDQGD